MSARPTDAPEEDIRRHIKHELRKRMRAVRDALPVASCEARSSEIAKRVIALERFRDAETLVAFASIRREVRTAALIDAAFASGRRVVLPRVVGEGLSLHLIDADTELVEGAFGVSEPPATTPEVGPDVVDFVLVPALAVDPQGYRIGYGGGFYDRLLPRMGRAYSCALAFDFQLIAEVPALPIDVPVDAVVTDTRVIEVAGIATRS